MALEKKIQITICLEQEEIDFIRYITQKRFYDTRAAYIRRLIREAMIENDWIEHKEEFYSENKEQK
ncbi:hypothetical protein [uncultured Campylobacter sp.]|uniref:hypothetical protein n=1 Tax=uncultured Campylobacter sp. TaxID=218934 RepID=UPI00262066D7|nr:hypothetical protein [uncultured Campylobacter sp.]